MKGGIPECIHSTCNLILKVASHCSCYYFLPQPPQPFFKEKEFHESVNARESVGHSW